MSRSPLSALTTDSLKMLATAIKAGRLRRRWTVAELAERVGVSHATITAVEAGKPGVAVGTVFEAATLVGVPLFSDDPGRRDAFAELKKAELALLPATARQRRVVDDDF